MKEHVSDPFFRLPEELQIRILGLLSTQERVAVSAVCQRWQGLVYDGSLWTCIDASSFYRIIPADQLVRLGMAGGKFLRILNLRGCVQLTGHGLRTLSTHCPNLHTVCFKDCRGVSTASLAFFLEHAAHLCDIDVSGVDSVRDSTLQKLVAHCPSVTALNLDWCRNVTGRGLQYLSRNATALCLRKLRISGCPKLTEESLETLQAHPFEQLSLAHCTSLTDALVARLMPQPYLSHLNLTGCVTLSDATLRCLAGSATRITHLAVAGCVHLTDQGFCHLATRLADLEAIDLEDLHQITSATITAFATYQPHLKSLCLSNCVQISDDAIINLILNGVCRNLCVLELDNCTVTDHCLDTISRHLIKPEWESPLPDSSISLRPSRKPQRPARLSIQVLDCANISEAGVQKALERASPRLNIKSFYSWQDPADDDDGGEDEEEEEEFHAGYLSGPGRTVMIHSSRYNTVARRRRRAHDGAGQPSVTNCIIL
ncbi:hypothetical protein BCR43DRAFT_520409 [Syncephalastrum racemosum]|uniref:F-box domain-containing protein n=1 Tax=Syncephalastrum racemosum TaxID=13706 RepID=A0A1X2HVV7_SYNRA|nr:hypothetical protein BCR43DRAFT_520409 [Syncephalastrum racemosum]